MHVVCSVSTSVVGSKSASLSIEGPLMAALMVATVVLSERMFAIFSANWERKWSAKSLSQLADGQRD